MRVLNDREEKSEQSDLGFLTVAGHSLFSALGLATVALGPLPLIFTHTRLAEPWPKVTAVAGAVIALLFFEASPALVALAFVFGLFTADSVEKGTPLWTLVGRSLLVAVCAGTLALLGSARAQDLGVLPYWNLIVDGWVAYISHAIQLEKAYSLEMMKGVFFYEGPFLYLSAAVLSLWFSLGAAAHFGWLRQNERFASEKLRAIRLPRWASLLFLALFVPAFLIASELQHFFSGIFRIAGALMFIQGCICLSTLLSRRMVRPGARTAIYITSIVLGFYVLMGFGVMSPWLLRKKGKLEESYENHSS